MSLTFGQLRLSFCAHYERCARQKRQRCSLRCVISFLPSSVPSLLASFPLLLPTIAVSVALCLPSFPSSFLWNCSWVRLLRAAVGNLVVGTLMAPLQLAHSLAAYVLGHCVPPLLLLLLFLFYKLLLLLLLGKS